MMKKNWLALMCLLFAAPNAFASVKLSLVGALNYNMDSVSSSVMGLTASVKGGLGFGGGLLVGLGAVELGGVFVSKSYTTSITGMADSSASVSAFQIPVTARIGGGSTTFGLGGFYETGGNGNYGLTAGPRFGGTNGGLFVDLRFNYGLKTPATKDVLALIGYAFGKK